MAARDFRHMASFSGTAITARMTRKKRIVLSTLAVVAILGGATAAWTWKTRGPILREVAQDLRAGARSRNAEKPFERFIELRYGPMTEPENRRKAFVGFFDPMHMEGMFRLVGFMTEGERRTNIAASAEWIARYRESMSPEEKQALAIWLNSPGTQADLQRASGLYRSRDIRYRAANEPVISELMTTLSLLRNQPSDQ
jgi:hypothetical protein